MKPGAVLKIKSPGLFFLVLHTPIKPANGQVLLLIGHDPIEYNGVFTQIYSENNVYYQHTAVHILTDNQTKALEQVDSVDEQTAMSLSLDPALLSYLQNLQQAFNSMHN